MWYFLRKTSNDRTIIKYAKRDFIVVFRSENEIIKLSHEIIDQNPRSPSVAHSDVQEINCDEKLVYPIKMNKRGLDNDKNSNSLGKVNVAEYVVLDNSSNDSMLASANIVKGIVRSSVTEEVGGVTS